MKYLNIFLLLLDIVIKHGLGVNSMKELRPSSIQKEII